MALPSDWATFLAAIRAQESGGNYTENTGACLGAYCWADQGSWTDMAVAAGEGSYATQNPSQVPPQVQDRVASANLYKAYQAAGGGTGGLGAAARWWNGGTAQSVPNPGLPAVPWARQCGGGSSGAYACQVLARMSLGGHYLSGTGSGAGGTVLTAGSQNNCLWSFGGIPGTSWIQDLFGSGGNVLSFCLISKSQARAVLAVGLIASGAALMLIGMSMTIGVAAARHVTNAVLRPVTGKPDSTPPKAAPPQAAAAGGGGRQPPPAAGAGQPARAQAGP